MLLTTLVSFFIVLLVLILTHELGHFFTAKLFKVRVEEFGIFLPPRVLSFKKGETTYSLNAIPLGGFNRLAGEEDPKVPGSLAGKSIPIRLLVLGAGSLMNIILPLVLLSVSYMIPHPEALANQQTGVGEVFVQAVEANSPAELAGVQAGDVILSVNGQTMQNVGDYEAIIKQNLGKEITIGIKQDNGTVANIKLTPRVNPAPGQGYTGVGIVTLATKSYPFWKAIPQGAVRYWDFLVLFKDGIVAAIKGTVPFEISGPVGIAQATGQVAREGISPLFQFAALISINLGIVNIFPIPALDGGRIVFVLVEWVRRGKRISPKTERMIHTIGFLLLFALIIFVTYRDIGRILNGQSLMPQG